MAELVIGGRDGDVVAAGLFDFGLDEAGDDFLLDGVISLKTEDLIADFAECGNGAEGDQLALFFQARELGVDGDVHLRPAQGGLLGTGGILKLGDDRQIRVVNSFECRRGVTQARKG